jgi:predicted Zn-dependent protease
MAAERRAIIEDVVRRAVAASRAPETEVYVSGGRESLTRFAGNAIHQNLSREVIEISIRALDGGRTGRATTTRTDDASLGETAARALATARRLDPNPRLLSVPAPFPDYPSLRCWDAETAAADPERRARGVTEVVEIAGSAGLSAAGSFTTDDRYEAIGNSKGLLTYGEYTSSVISTTMTGPTSTGYAEDGASAIGRIDPAGIGRRAAEKAARAAEPDEVPPGEYTAILEPVAVGELLSFLVYGASFCHLSGLGIEDGESWFAARMGTKVFGENVTLRDDVAHPTQTGVGFDAEGVPRRSLTLIDKGVARAVTYDRATAQRAGASPTGHGLPVPNTIGSVPQHLVLEGGTTSIDEMVRTTKRGILVTRLWYVRTVDPADLIVTGLTRDGTFLIEDGAIVRGLRSYRVNQSLRAMLNQVTALSPTVRAAPGITAPALRVDGFGFSAVVPKEP